MHTLSGDTLQSGPGGAYRDGSLGSAMQSGPGGAFTSGVLGEHLQAGPGRAVRDGSLGYAQMQAGPGRAMQDGSLGALAIGTEMIVLGVAAFVGAAFIAIKMGVHES